MERLYIIGFYMVEIWILNDSNMLVTGNMEFEMEFSGGYYIWVTWRG